MTARELAEQLMAHPDREVIMLKDPGGDRAHRPLSNVYFGVYVPANTWSGDAYTPDEADEYLEPEEPRIQAVILEPIF